eukprot:366162-Chlamydomonas_euryale.AAC.10
MQHISRGESHPLDFTNSALEVPSLPFVQLEYVQAEVPSLTLCNGSAYEPRRKEEDGRKHLELGIMMCALAVRVCHQPRLRSHRGRRERGRGRACDPLSAEAIRVVAMADILTRGCRIRHDLEQPGFSLRPLT